MRTSWGVSQDQLLITRIDDLGATIYIGYGRPGALTNEASWRVLRLLQTGSETVVTFADGDDKFDNVWDDRASLAYN